MCATATSKKLTLSARKTTKATKESGPIKLSDRDGLYLNVAVSGSKVWMLAYRHDGRQKAYKLGPYLPGAFDLEEARARAFEVRKLISAGIDPRLADAQQKLQNEASQQSTLWAVTELWLEHRKDSWAPRTYERAKGFLERYVRDGLGRMPVTVVDAGMVHSLIGAIAKGKTGKERRAAAPTSALAVRQMLSEVFQYAIGTSRATTNPVTMMRAGLAVQKPKTRHNKALDSTQLERLLTALECASLLPVTRAAVNLLFMTAVRVGELTGAAWTEFDLNAALWTIPACRMKGRETHLVPLPDQAVTLLRGLHKLTGKQEWVFPNYRDASRHMNITTFTTLFRRLGFNDEQWFRSHGVRGSFSTWANEHDYPSDHIEKSLAHVEKDTVRLAYNAARWLPQRRVLMQAWSDHLDALVAPQAHAVIPQDTSHEARLTA